MNTRSNHGRYSEDTQRDKRWKEMGRQEHLQSESSSSQGSLNRKTSRERDRILFIENLSIKPPPFTVKNAQSIHDVLSEVVQRFPALANPRISINIHTNHLGSSSRKELKGLLPYENVFLYIKVSLHK